MSLAFHCSFRCCLINSLPLKTDHCPFISLNIFEPATNHYQYCGCKSDSHPHAKPCALLWNMCAGVGRDKEAEHDLQMKSFQELHAVGFQLFFQWIHNSLNVLIICLSNSGTIIEAGGFPKGKTRILSSVTWDHLHRQLTGMRILSVFLLPRGPLC